MAAPGELLASRYELIQPIGSGGMATVWRARDTRLGRQVAVKLLRPEFAEDDEFVRRFETEARHAASLSHPNVAAVHDTDVDGERRFIVMELVDGPSVAEVIAQRGPLEPIVAVEITASAARALAAAHRRGLIHRDVKPGNLLIGRDGRVRLADFGIARALTSSRATTPGTVLGSIPYLSPEQARGEEATAAGDIFSLGVVLFEMLTGSLPWEADTPAAMATARLHVPAAPPSDTVAGLPDGLDGIVGRALELDPEKRYPSARVFADALEGWSRRHRAPSGGRAKIRHATEALAASVLPIAAGGRGSGGAGARAASVGGAAAAGTMAGTASPNPFAAPPVARGGTRVGPRVARRKRPAPEGAPAPEQRPPEVADAGIRTDVADEDPDRRAGLLIAGLAFALVVVVAAAFFASGGPPATPEVPGVGAATAAPASWAPAATEPIAIPPAPTASPTLAPTEPPVTPAPTPGATPRPPSAPDPTPLPPRPLSPAGAVLAFYDAVETHDWDTAIDLWSPSMQERYPPQEWLINRFRRTTRIDVTRIETVSNSGGRARVEVSLTEYRTVEPSPRRFVGAWDLVLRDGRWLLNDPDF
jgi:hypothetical protein